MIFLKSPRDVICVVLSCLFGAVSLTFTFLYALYVCIFWFSASVGLWKGYASEVTPAFAVVLYVLPAFGLAVTHLGKRWLPSAVDERVAAVVTGVGLSALTDAVVMVCLPIASLSL